MPLSRLFRYENKLLLLLSFMFGFVIFDRLALSFLVPFLDRELGLNNTQIGLLVSILALAWAVSGYLAGTLSDRTGKRKKYLLISVTIFSICSCLSGLATGFAFLLATRILMGLAEGPVLPLAQSIMVESSPEMRRGLNMGLLQTLGSNVLATMAPILLVVLAKSAGWRNAFFIAGIPGISLAAIGFFYIKEPRAVKAAPLKEKTAIGTLLKYRNVWVCILLSCCLITWLSVQVAFLPKYLVSVKHLSGEDMGKTMTALGLAAIIWGVIVPALSDRFGRKPLAVIFFLLSAVLPLGILYFGNDFKSLFLIVLLGAPLMGGIPVVMSTIPSETIPRRYIAQTLGLVMGVGEVVGGFAAPAVAGWSADVFGLQAPFLIAAGATLTAGLVAFLLHETAPALLNKKGELTSPVVAQQPE